MTTHRLVLVPLAALLAAPTVGLAQSTSYMLKGDSVAVYNLVGELRVEPATARGGDVTVELRRGGADAARLDVRTGPLRGRETLRVIYPDDVISLPDWGGGRGWNTTLRVRDDGTFGDGVGGTWRREGRQVRITGRGRGLEAYADLRVTVPAGKRVALYVGLGKAFVSNVDGVIRMHVASGDVTAGRTRGTLKIETGSGNVDLRDGAGDVSLETGSGDVTASGAQGDNLSFETGSGNVDVALLAAFRSLTIETGSGNVRLRVPATIGAEVDLETGSGDIDLGGVTLQVRRLAEDHITGTIGDGRGRLSIETGSGNVRLVKS